MKFIPCAAMRHANRCNNSDCVFDIIIFWHFRRCPPCTRQPYKNVNRIVIRHCSSPFCFLFLHGWPESNRLVCRWGIRTAGNFLLHPHIKTHRAREVARWGDPLRSGLLPFAWAIGTGRFCAHAATCRSAYTGLPCGHGLGNTDRSDFRRLIRKVSVAFSASVFPCQFWKMNKP